MSLYSHKHRGTGAVQPWSQTITLAEAGKGCDGLFNLYDSLGDKTLVGVNTISTLLDGPEKVVRYGALTLGDGTTPTSLTASNRCKGLAILCDSLTVKGNATLHMTGRGARVLTNDDPVFPFVDFRIPFRVTLASSRVALAQALNVIKANGLAPWDAGTFQHFVAALYGFDLSVSLAGSVALMLASGCGVGGAGYTSTNVRAGNTGGGGVNGGMGGGGSGGMNYINGTGYIQYGGRGCPYSGGSGSGGGCPQTNNYFHVERAVFSGPGGRGGLLGVDDYSDPIVNKGLFQGSGGAGNPGGLGAVNTGGKGGDGCGGKLTIICRGAITVQSGGKIEANGVAGGSGSNYGGGAGSGGGHISLASPSAPSNAGTIQCVGGVGGDMSSTKGGDGGVGSVVTKTFSDMGW